MVIKLKPMKGVEFVAKVLAGERDFSNIRLESSFNLAGCDGFNDLQAYLRKTDLSENYLTIDGSRLLGINAAGLYLPFVHGKDANLREADLSGADLSGADLYRAYLCRANLCDAILSEANLREANLRRANFYRANLCDAILSGANLRGAYFYETNLSRAKLIRADLY